MKFKNNSRDQSYVFYSLSLDDLYKLQLNKEGRKDGEEITFSLRVNEK